MQQLESDLERMAKDKREVMEALYKSRPVTNALTLQGTIDGHKVEVFGMIPRKGPNSHNPPGPCMFCTAMIELGTTKLLAEYGTRCQWAD